MFASKHRKYELFPLVYRRVVPGLFRTFKKFTCSKFVCLFLALSIVRISPLISAEKGVSTLIRREALYVRDTEATRIKSPLLRADFWEGDATKHFSVKKGVFSKNEGGNSVNEGFGNDFFRKGNSMKTCGPFSEPPDSEN